MARRRGNKIKVYVTLTGGKKYGFSTQEAIRTRRGAAAGMTSYAGAAGVFFGANSPKPSRATWLSPAGNESTFVSTASIPELRKADDVIITSNTTTRALQTSGKTRTVYVNMPGGWKYAWNITAAEASLAGELGFTPATGADANDLIWGVQTPKPPRASKLQGGSRISTFIEPTQAILDAAAAKGWTISGVTDLNDPTP